MIKHHHISNKLNFVNSAGDFVRNYAVQESTRLQSSFPNRCPSRIWLKNSGGNRRTQGAGAKGRTSDRWVCPPPSRHNFVFPVEAGGGGCESKIFRFDQLGIGGWNVYTTVCPNLESAPMDLESESFTSAKEIQEICLPARTGKDGQLTW